MCDASNFGVGAAILQAHKDTNKMTLHQQSHDFVHKQILDSLPLSEIEQL